MSSISNPTSSNQGNIKCCKSGWRLCKNGQWKFLIARGRRQRIQDVDPQTGEQTTRIRFIPPAVGPACIWVTQEKLREYRNKRLKITDTSANANGAAQLCNQCNNIAINTDICPHCQTLLINTISLNE